MLNRKDGKRSSSTKRVAVWIATIAAVMALLPAVAHAGPEQQDSTLSEMSDLRSISGATPMPSEWEGATQEGLKHCGTGEKERHWEQDNSLAVDPTNPDNLAAAWMQDWNDAIVVGYSRDGGDTWGTSVPPTTPCTLGITKFGEEPDTVSVLDPSISFGADGMLYLTSVITSNSGSAAVVDRSVDGGRTWIPWNDEANILHEAAFPESVDVSHVVADPLRPGVAFATWYVINPGTGLSTYYLTSTTDGGDNWSDPSEIGPKALSFAARLLVLRDGSLLSIGGEYPPQVGALPGQFLNGSGGSFLTGPTTLVARTLAKPTDDGSTWSSPTVIGIADPKRFVIPGATLGPDGVTAYVIWSTTTPSRSGFNMMFATSRDGGANWTTPASAGPGIVGLPATGNNDIPIAPSISVTPDGVIGVAFYDHRRDVPTTPARETDVWLRYSGDGGASWQERYLAGRFDMNTAPLPTNCIPTGCLEGLPRKERVADINGIVAIPGGLAAIFSLATPLEGANYELETQYTETDDGVRAVKNTDIFFTRLVDPAADVGLSMAVSPDPARSGKSLTYTITVTNDGPSEAVGVTLTDYLPATAIFGSASTTQGTCALAPAHTGAPKGGAVTCSLSNLAAGQTVAVTIDVRATQNGSVTNIATVSATSPPDPDTTNNRAQTSMEVHP